MTILTTVFSLKIPRGDFLRDNGQLRSLSDHVNSSFCVSTASSLATDCYWTFDVNLKLATSGSNYADIYLISDSQDLKSSHIQGYFVRIGNTADEISLYKRNGTLKSAEKIIDGEDGIVAGKSNNTFRIRVSRDAVGVFNLERDATGTGNSFVSEGTVLDQESLSSAYFGIYIRQSLAMRKPIKPVISGLQPPQWVSLRQLAKTLRKLFLL